MKRIDSKLDELEKEENEIDTRKRYALPPLPDIALEDIYSNPKWYSRSQHYRPRFRKLQFKKGLQKTDQDSDSDVLKNDILNNDISSDNTLTYDTILDSSNDGDSISNSITPELHSDSVISSNLDDVNSDTLSQNNYKRMKELEQALDYVTRKVNKLIRKESENNSEWFEEKFNEVGIDPADLKEETDQDEMANILQDLSYFADQLNESDRSVTKGKELSAKKDDIDESSDGSLTEVVSRLSRRIDQVIKALPPVPLQNADSDAQVDEKALPPLPNSRALPPLPNSRALPPLPKSRALPPLPNSRALPPLPNSRALPPLPKNRALSYSFNPYFPSLPYRLSQDKKRDLVEHINELTKQIKSLSSQMDHQDYNVHSNPSQLLFDNAGSSDLNHDKNLISDMKDLSVRVEKLMKSYKRHHQKDTGILNKAYEDSMISKESLDPIEKPLTLRTAEFKTDLDADDDIQDTENLEESLSNLAKRRDVKLDVPQDDVSAILPSTEDLSSDTEQSDNDEISQYIQRINHKVDQILLDGEQELDSEDELLNHTQRGKTIQFFILKLFVKC